ncbi:hypothetical protein [Evansella tamaricis]|uniref:Uncharacterized protein n=1 Tax=Evansella tamaricis TaxID=2069301 RepID=A0ABS6JIZ9_9BACI|nr:hypothetical protein [Evansella tamaricis]MBU9713656.1 hypothetical protein [Evansella tamaricis]
MAFFFIMITVAFLFTMIGIFYIAAGIIVLLWNILIIFVKGLFHFFGTLFLIFFDYFKIHKKEPNYLSQDTKQKRNQQLLKDQKKARDEKLLWEGLAVFMEELEEKYPEADPLLLKQIENELLDSTRENALRYYEELVKVSHQKNKHGDDYYKIYCFNDLENRWREGIKWIAPFMVEIYLINEMYIFRVTDERTGDPYLFQSMDYYKLMNYVKSASYGQTPIYSDGNSMKAVRLEEII